GGAIEGNCATGRLKMVSEPTSTRTIEITIATIGRWMKNFDMTSPARCLSHKRLGIYSRTGAHLLDSLCHHVFAWLQPVRDDPLVANNLTDSDGTNAHLVVSVHDGDLVRTLQFGNGPLWDKEGAVLDSNHRADFAITAGLQNVCWIREEPG